MQIKAKKSLGQNFLSNPQILKRVIDAAEIKKDDTVIEIGPGTGNLTKLLAEKAGRVIAIEKDHRLIPLLKSDFNNGNVEIIENDILRLNLKDLLRLNLSKYKVVGNIPYYLTSHLLRTIFESWSRLQDDRGFSTKSGPKLELIVLTVQKEVAQRIVAKPPNMSILSVSVQFYSTPEIISYVSKGNFQPQPKVDSAILKLTTNNKKQTINSKKFFDLVRLGFSSKRKKLINNLSKEVNNSLLQTIFNKLKINTNARAQELSLEEWLEIAANLNSSW